MTSPSSLQEMERRVDDYEFLLGSFQGFNNRIDEVVFSEDVLLVVESTLFCFEHYLKPSTLSLEIVSLLIGLSRDEACRQIICSQGLRLISSCLKETDEDFLLPVLQLTGRLAFEETNLRYFEYFKVVGLVLNAVCDHAESRDLILAALQVLDNVAVCSIAMAHLVLKENGVETLPIVVEAYADDAEIVRLCDGILSTLEVASREKTRLPRRNTFTKKVEKREYSQGEDPLKNFRHMLKAGTLLTEWSSAGPQLRHVSVNKEFSHVVSIPGNSLATKKRQSIHSRSFPLSELRSVVDAGKPGEEKLKLNVKADASMSFHLVGRTTVAFEAPSLEDHKAWMEALNALIYCVKNDASWLKG